MIFYWNDVAFDTDDMQPVATDFYPFGLFVTKELHCVFGTFFGEEGIIIRPLGLTELQDAAIACDNPWLRAAWRKVLHQDPVI